MGKILTRQELEERIDEINSQIREERDISTKDNLQTNLNNFMRLLRYYNGGFGKGFSNGQQDVIDTLKLFDWDSKLTQKTGGK